MNLESLLENAKVRVQDLNIEDVTEEIFDKSEILMKKGTDLLLEGKMNSSLELFNEALQVNPYNFNALGYLGSVADGNGDEIYHIYLRDTDDQVEEECNKLRKQYPEEFDLVLGILKGTSYNHTYRRAIKKGLQNVPSQIVKFNKFNSPNIFKDQYSPSIFSF